ncbi:MAG: DnaJ C-terminal domain-containing protein [Pseudohongiellaceae bacterium]
MEFKDYYDILGVSPDADKPAIKKAYRRLARKYHPDVSSEHEAEKHFKEIAEAYEVIGDDQKRAEYDQLRKYGRKGEAFSPPPGWQGQAGGFTGGNGDFSEFFESIFGRGFGGQQRGGFAGGEDMYSTRGQDVELELPVFLEDTLKSESRTIEYNLPHYGETGRLADIKKTLKVKLPKGAVDGERIRLKGQGAPGFGKGTAGDLYLRIRLVPHPLFDVNGQDLSITLPIAPWEAALGAKVTVPTLDGKISLNIAPQSQTGQKLRVKGRGLPGKTEAGDLFVILKVVMPDKITAEMEKLWGQLAAGSGFDPRANMKS